MFHFSLQIQLQFQTFFCLTSIQQAPG
jgi:hypothetical protein